MKKPPERKVMLAALVLLVAAGVMITRPASGGTKAGFQKTPDPTVVLRKG